MSEEAVKVACPIETGKEAKESTNEAASLKPCCACPETRKLRDECVLLKGEENCVQYIEAHRQCLKSYGFIV